MIIKKTYTVTIKIDTEKAKEWKNGNYDWDTYPNWDIHYGDAPLNFIKMIWADFRASFKYKGLQATIKENTVN